MRVNGSRISALEAQIHYWEKFLEACQLHQSQAYRKGVDLTPSIDAFYTYYHSDLFVCLVIFATFTMISSAVVIPEQEHVHGTNGTSASPTLKRKLSHSSPNDRKRPKVDTNSDILNYDDATKSASPEDVKLKSTTQNSPPRRRPAPAVEEKKRNQRLFGSLLGTLSQSNTKSNPAHKKRDEIEARQRERLKREHEEQESARKRKKEDLAKKRRKEQRHWEEQSQRLKHANMRAMAGFLRTKTEPVLYYLPWELRHEEEILIERQKDEADRLIQEELGDIHHETRPVVPDENEDSSLEVPNENQHPENGTETPIPVENGHAEAKTSDNSNQRSETETPDPQIEDMNHTEPEVSHENISTDENLRLNNDSKDDDHNGEELVEGQEDDVIY